MMASLAIRAEQALLGSVLLEPAGQQHVLDLVEPGDMYRPWHGQVLSAMQRVRGKGLSPGLAEVYEELREDPDLPATVSQNGVPLIDLMEAVPSAEHAATYAAIVAENGIRQQLELAGSRLAQVAHDSDLEAALRQCAQARRELCASHARWLAIPEPFRRAQVRERIAGRHLPGAAARTSGRPGESDGLVVGPVHPQGPEAEAIGKQALRDLAAGPGHIAHVRRWLRPEYFARAEDGDLFAVMRDLDTAGRPVDPVTVTWEAARRGIQSDVGQLVGGNAPFAVASARKVCRYGLLAQVAATGRDVQVGALDPSRDLTGLLQSADDRLRVLAPTRQPEHQPGRDARVITIPRQGKPGEQPRRPDREAVP
jgi:replicative DNA helicase